MTYVLSTSAIGIITTHDLELADSSSIRESLRMFHFRDSISDANGTPQMIFDYKLYQGPTKHTNAIKIIELMGLP
jgi:DNA mismatch repair ATPase MutS